MKNYILIISGLLCLNTTFSQVLDHDGYCDSSSFTGYGIRPQLKKLIQNPVALPNPSYPLSLPTPDHSGQAVHPTVIDFYTEYGMNSWAGYRYWMSYNPYTNTDALTENPCLAGSHDGRLWYFPGKLKNPVAVPDPVHDVANLADANAVYNPDTDELWIYYYEVGQDTLLRTCTRFLKMVKVKPDMKYTKPVILFSFDCSVPGMIISPSIWREHSTRWHMWAVTMANPQYLVYSMSTDGITWPAFKQCKDSSGNDPVLNAGYRSWHVGCKPNHREQRVEFIINASQELPASMYPPYNTKYLLYAECDMSKPDSVCVSRKPILFASKDPTFWDFEKVYRTSFVIDDRDTGYGYKIWYSAMNARRWYVGYVEGEIHNHYNQSVFKNEECILPSGNIAIRTGDSIKLNVKDNCHYTYQWYKNGTKLANQTSSYLYAREKGSYAVMIKTEDNSMIKTNPVYVSLQSTFTIYPTGTINLCYGERVVLQTNTGNGKYYQWFYNGNPIPGATSYFFKTSTAGQYKLQVTDGGLTYFTNQTEIRYKFKPKPFFIDKKEASCRNDSVLFSTIYDSTLSYKWLRDDIWLWNNQSSKLWAKDEGIYNLIEYNNCGADTASQHLTVNPRPEPVHLWMLEDTIQATTKGFVEWHMLRDGFDYILNNNGKDHYFPREEGEYYAIVYNTFGCTQASANVIKIGTVPETSSIEARDEISVFPNPVADVLSVTAPAGSIISVIDITGGTIFDQTAVSEVSEINVHSWSAGMYLVRIRDKGNARLIKVVKQ